MRVGIVGAGQLGQMLGNAARDLGIECEFLDPSDNPPALSAGNVIKAPYDDPDALATLAANCDVLTYEFENVPVDALAKLNADIDIYPPLAALHSAQDRLLEKALFAKLNMQLPGYCAVDTREDLEAAAKSLGLPFVLKTRRFGYDGKGQFVVRTTAEIEAAWTALGGQPLIAEAFVRYDSEMSIIAARSTTKDIAIYPLSKNHHRDGILHTSVSPILNATLTKKAETYVVDLLRHLDYVGVLALELFVVGDDLLVNEFAPRVHNSGHWSIEGSTTSQFHNHILAVSGRPLGPTDPSAHAGMVNLIGTISDAARHLSDGHFHDYGKEARAGRKLGHITVTADSPGERDALVLKMSEM